MFECCREKIRIAADLLSLYLWRGAACASQQCAVVSDEVSHCLSTDRDGLSLHAVRCRLQCTLPLPSGEITRATLFWIVKTIIPAPQPPQHARFNLVSSWRQPARPATLLVRTWKCKKSALPIIFKSSSTGNWNAHAPIWHLRLYNANCPLSINWGDFLFIFLVVL